MILGLGETYRCHCLVCIPETIFKVKNNYNKYETSQILQEASASLCLRLATGLA